MVLMMHLMYIHCRYLVGIIQGIFDEAQLSVFASTQLLRNAAKRKQAAKQAMPAVQPPGGATGANGDPAAVNKLSAVMLDS